MALSAREKAEAARYKPSKKKKSIKKKKVTMQSAREKAEAARYKTSKNGKSLRPKARGYKISTTTVSITPTKKPQDERRRNILSEKAALDKEIARIQKMIDANRKKLEKLNK